jgi:hypothetical protein
MPRIGSERTSEHAGLGTRHVKVVPVVVERVTRVLVITHVTHSCYHSFRFFIPYIWEDYLVCRVARAGRKTFIGEKRPAYQSNSISDHDN